MKISNSQEHILLDLARKTILARLNKSEYLVQTPAEQFFREKAATFVTLKISSKLRGCIGHLEPVNSLWESVRDNAISAAFHDHRFSPLNQSELEETLIDISILTPPIPLEYADSDDLLQKIRPGIDGVILRDGRRGATFLPQVWQQLPSAEMFLDQLCRKAGLKGNGWKGNHLEVKIYQVVSFKERDRCKN